MESNRENDDFEELEEEIAEFERFLQQGGTALFDEEEAAAEALRRQKIRSGEIPLMDLYDLLERRLEQLLSSVRRMKNQDPIGNDENRFYAKLTRLISLKKGCEAIENVVYEIGLSIEEEWLGDDYQCSPEEECLRDIRRQKIENGEITQRELYEALESTLESFLSVVLTAKDGFKLAFILLPSILDSTKQLISEIELTITSS